MSKTEDNNTTQKKEVKNELYLFLDTIKNIFPSNEIEGIKDFCFVFKKTDLNDILFMFSYCSSNFPNQQESIGYKGVIKINNLNILIFDKDDTGIELYKDGLQIEEPPDFKKHKSNFQMVICGYWKDNKLREVSVHEIVEKGWEQYFKCK